MKPSRQLPFDRAARVSERVLHAVSTACQYELSDPRLEGLRITRVKMTKDLRIARIFFYIPELGSERRQEMEAGLQNAVGFLKRVINEALQLKFVPEVEIFFDDVLADEEYIQQLLGNLDGAPGR